MQIYFSEPIQKARRFWATDLGEEMTLAEFEARFPEWIASRANEWIAAHERALQQRK